MTATATRPSLAGLWAGLEQPVDLLPMVIFRVGFGLLSFAGVVRFWLRGWIHEQYIAPAYHFAFIPGLEPLPGAGMYWLFGLMAAAALMIAAGLFYHLSAAAFFGMFTYVELLDKAYYLNHYYLISLLALLLICLPANRTASLDVLLFPHVQRRYGPAWVLWIVRFQVGVVYFFAGVAKLSPDWLLNALPLAIWLPARASMPLIGPLFDQPATAYLMSWAGAVFDLSIPFWLAHRRTRPYAYAAVLIFHSLTGLLFPTIGLFPFIMSFCALIFFDGADWRPAGALMLPAAPPGRVPLAAKALLSAYVLAQLALPLRHHLLPGDVLFNEAGGRFAWRVMLAEKTGHAVFHLEDPASGRRWVVYPSTYLTPQQEKQMSFQPDMLRQFAEYLCAEYAAQADGDVSVQVEAYASVNGRASRLLFSQAEGPGC